MVKLFTDGSSKGNPGPGGFGAILQFKGYEKEISAGYRKTTNNRMELMAVIAGLEALTRDGLQITIYSDSKYVVDPFEKGWIFGWIKKGFAKQKNPDLWKRMIKSYEKHNIKFVWIKGHAGHPENERCDVLAVAAGENYPLLIDTGYEQSEISDA